MAWIPTVEEARTLMQAHNQEAFHRLHAETVSGVLRIFARELAPGEEEYWAAVGLLHDLDWEEQPQRHCLGTSEILKEMDIEPAFLRAIVSHGWGISGIEEKPEKPMEKALYAVDELTGLIGAAAKMRPSGSVSDMELKSLKKKYKTTSFAAGCSREVIQRGADLLGWPLDELLQKTLDAMREMEAEA